MAYKKSYTKIIVAGQTDVAPSEHTDELTLAAGSNITLTTSDDTVTIAASGGGGSSTSISDADSDTKIQLEESSDEDKIRFDTAGSERMIITEAGKVGIGTSTPSRALDVNGSVKFRGDGSTANILGPHTSEPAITIDSSSNVTLPQNVIIDGDGASDGVTITDGAISMRTGTGSAAKIDMYCEVSNAHKVTVKAPPHSEYSGDVNFQLPSSNGTSGQFLQTDGSGNTSWASASGGGSSSSKYVMRLAGRFLVNTSTGLMTHGSSMGNALGGDFNLARTDIGNLSNTSFTVTNRQAAYYYVIGVAPSDCTLDEVVVYTQLRYTFANAPKFRCWRGTFTNNTAGDVTWTQVHAAEPIGSSTSTADVGCVATKSISSGNSFNAGDLVSFTFEYGGSAQYSLNQFTATLLFTES